MKTKLGQEPAFPVVDDGNGKNSIELGISKRFYAACAAMQGLISLDRMSPQDVSISAFQFADALLEQESK